MSLKFVSVLDEQYAGLNAMHFGYEDCAPAHAYGPAVRTFWLIHFVVSGSGIFKIGEKTYTVGAGEMFVIPPYEETFYQASEDNPWSYIWIGFTDTSGLSNRLSHVTSLPEASVVFQEMKGCDRYSHGKSAFLTARLWDLFALLLEEEPKKKDYVEEALEYIHSEYMYDVTVDKIARRLNLERTYFSSLFKKRMGLSPKQYLLSHRMSVAASLLSGARVPIAVAAYSVGYTDVFNFSKMFKKHFGVCPSRYVSARTLSERAEI